MASTKKVAVEVASGDDTKIMDLISRYRKAMWSLRKLRLGIGPKDLVLDVGSGGKPHPRANVLLEKYVDGFHRHGAAAVADRPMVFSDAGAMPFRDKAFDFVIAFHVLEHMRDPARFLGELSRVGKAGYIETPNVIFERFAPYDVHLLEIMELDGCLHINKKARSATDSFMQQLSLHKSSRAWQRAIYGNPDLFHVRFFWTETIPFSIVNPEEPCDWFVDAPESSENEVVTSLPRGKDWRGHGIAGLRKWYGWRQAGRNRIEDLLVCPACHGNLATRDQNFICSICRVRFAAHPHPNFNKPVPLE